MGGILLQVGLQSSLEEDSPAGRTPFGSRSPIGTPHLLGRPRQPLGHLYNEGEGQGAQLDETLAPWCLPSPSKPCMQSILDDLGCLLRRLEIFEFYYVSQQWYHERSLIRCMFRSRSYVDMRH